MPSCPPRWRIKDVNFFICITYSVEQTVASLLDVFHQLPAEGSHVFKSQLLVAVTNLLLEKDVQVI